MTKRWIFLLPLIIFLAVAVLLYRGLFLHPETLPSALINKPFPDFSLQNIKENQVITKKDLMGKPALVNVWATWCPACKEEHPLLAKLSQQGILIYGINYKDDNILAEKWLKEFRNPYKLVISDKKGTLGFDLGVYGAPETFLIDKQGIIRHKIVGIIDEKNWEEELKPLYKKLASE